MSIGFNWLRRYRIAHRTPDAWYNWYELEFLDGGSTSHSAGNIIAVQDLIEKYGNKRIPYIYEEYIDSLDYDLGLIKPGEMYEICQFCLAQKLMKPVCVIGLNGLWSCPEKDIT